jgi:hypothetical protein
MAFRLEAMFTDAKLHLPVEPSAIRLTVKPPHDAVKVFNEFERDKPGRYAVDFEATSPGAYRILWEASGSHAGHSEAWLHVKAIAGN